MLVFYIFLFYENLIQQWCLLKNKNADFRKLNDHKAVDFFFSVLKSGHLDQCGVQISKHTSVSHLKMTKLVIPAQ